MKYLILFSLLFTLTSCHYRTQEDSLTMIQIQDRNGLTETISQEDRLSHYEPIDFFSSQPYKKVLRIYKSDGKTHSKITTYHPNGSIHKYLEAEEMRAKGIYREWFANGQLKIEAHVIGGTADIGSQDDWLFDGTSHVWDQQGNLIAKIPYSKGVLEGMSIYYYSTGQIEREIPFTKNEIDGEVVEYFPDGAIRLKAHYKEGIKKGQGIGFFPDGKLAWTEEYTENRILKGTYYNPEGEMISEIDNGGGFQALYEGNALTLIEFRIGEPNGIVKKFNAFGKLERSLSIKNGKKNGEEIEYYLDTSTPKLSIIWKENIIHGCVKTWYDNGQLQSQREYVHNLKSGPALAWYRDGSLMLVEEYEEDRLTQGKYFKMHKKEAISTITNGNGLATLYDENGIFLRKLSYVKGNPIEP